MFEMPQGVFFCHEYQSVRCLSVSVVCVRARLSVAGCVDGSNPASARDLASVCQAALMNRSSFLSNFHVQV